MKAREEAALRWWAYLRKGSNEAFLPLFFDKHRFLVLKGGGGSGKSIFAGRKIVERCVAEPGHRVLVCRKVGLTLRHSCFDQLCSQAAELYPGEIDKINRSDMMIRWKNGSVILFAGLDDVEKLKSIYDITMIWIEEASEIEEADLNQLDIRLRTETPYYLQIIITFNPISITHWLKGRFFDRKDKRATVHESTYRDNRFLIGEARETLEAFKETDPYFYTVYCLGQWGVTGKTVFPAGLLTERRAALGKPVKEGLFEYVLSEDGIHVSDIRWVDEPGGPVRIYREAEKGHPYVIGGDTAGDGSDWFVGQCIDNSSGVQAAVLRHQYDEDTYARQMYCLGRYYNEALLGIETNYSTYPVKLLRLMGYPRLYVREREDSFGGIVQAFGFDTTPVTRPVILGDLVRIVRMGAGWINDETTIDEMLTFVRNEKLRAEAAMGAHDDTVMALAIAEYIRDQQRSTVEREEPEGVTWTEDQWEDYRHATKEEKEMLVKMWGRPR